MRAVARATLRAVRRKGPSFSVALRVGGNLRATGAGERQAVWTLERPLEPQRFLLCTKVAIPPKMSGVAREAHITRAQPGAILRWEGAPLAAGRVLPPFWARAR